MTMKKFDPRLWLGVLLVFGGVLALLDAMNVISNSGGIFWGLIFAAGGALFLYMLLSDRNNWWAAFPAFTLLGLAAQSILPPALSSIDGLVSLPVSALPSGGYTLRTLNAGGPSYQQAYCSHWVLSPR